MWNSMVRAFMVSNTILICPYSIRVITIRIFWVIQSWVQISFYCLCYLRWSGLNIQPQFIHLWNGFYKHQNEISYILSCKLPFSVKTLHRSISLNVCLFSYSDHIQMTLVPTFSVNESSRLKSSLAVSSTEYFP